MLTIIQLITSYFAIPFFVDDLSLNVKQNSVFSKFRYFIQPFQMKVISTPNPVCETSFCCNLTVYNFSMKIQIDKDAIYRIGSVLHRVDKTVS